MLEVAPRDETFSAPSLESVTEPVRPAMEALDRFLGDQVEAFEPEVRELVAYVLKHSGKRLRPILCLLSGWDPEGRDEDARIRAGAIIELVHLATLVHDDILDDADLRHSQRTASAQYGRDAAVLLGDALFAHALKLAADFPTVEVCREVARATRRVCAGEISQTLQRGNLELSREAYVRIIDLKTAELFRVACFLGARNHPGSPPDFAEASARFGQHLGRAYQIFDDVADIIGKEQRIGKTLGTDLASGKLTLPLILWREAKSGDDLVALLERPEAEITETLRTGGYIEETVAAFQAEVDAAETALEPFADWGAADRLRDLARLVRGLFERLAV